MMNCARRSEGLDSTPTEMQGREALQSARGLRFSACSGTENREKTEFSREKPKKTGKNLWKQGFSH